MKTTMSPFHDAAGTHTTNSAPELSLASGSVQDNPSARGTRVASGDRAGSRALGVTGRSEHALNARSRSTALEHAAIRFMAISSVGWLRIVVPSTWEQSFR